MRTSGLSSRRAPIAPPDARVRTAAEGEVLRLRAQVERLSHELEGARYELARMREAYADRAGSFMTRWGLTRGEALFLAVLVERGSISREGMDLALYGDEPRGDKVLDVWLCKVRAKVAAAEIETIHGWGWTIAPASRAAIAAEIGEGP